ncbi:unnamed protein product [Calypogeia fissa]
MKEKSQVFEIFKEWKAKVELQTGKELKCVRSDNGGEYRSNEFDKFGSDLGLKHHYTIPDTPEQNGVAERLNRTLLEKTRSMLSKSKLPQSFWAEVVNHAAYVYNLSPHSTKFMQTPFDLWYKRPADYSQLRIFGCAAYVHIELAHRTKLDPTFKKCIFLGFSPGQKGYKLWDPVDCKVVVSKNVVFDEDWMSRPRDDLEVEQKESTEVEIDGIEEPVGPSSKAAVPPLRRSTRANIGQAPARFTFADPHVQLVEREDNPSVVLLTEDGDPSSYEEAMASPGKDKWFEAMVKEMNSLQKNLTWRLVTLPKVIKLATIRVLLAIVTFYDMELDQMDVITAFLDGLLDVEIYMAQPEGFITEDARQMVCLLSRSLYGLKQSPRQWNKRFDSFMLSNGFTCSDSDSCIYIKEVENFTSFGYIVLALYVDDMLIATENKSNVAHLKAMLSLEFSMKDLVLG